MKLTKRTLAAAVGALVIVTGGGVAYAASASTTATCTANPAITVGATTQSFDVHCSVPKVAATSTVTSTTTVTAPAQTVTVTASPTSSTTTATTTTTSTPSPTTTTAAAGTYPDASTTGVPAGVALTTYTGPMTITAAGTVIDGKTINGTLAIRAGSVTVKNSRINGSVYVDADGYPNSYLNISDSEIIQPQAMGSGLDVGNYTATRIEITGGNRSAWCNINCTIADSYVHGQFRDSTGQAHESGIRVGSYSTIRGNTIHCDAPTVADAGCSADLTGYPDFAAIHHNTIDGNLFKATPSGGWCGYFGDTKGKPYSGQTTNITVTNNVFERASASKPDCGLFGSTTDFPTGDANSRWSNNKMTDGEVIQPNW